MYYPLFKEGEINWGGGEGTWNIKRGWKYDLGAYLLKRGREGGTFPIQFFQGLSFSALEITYPFQSCVMHLKKKNLFCHYNVMKKGHSKLSKKGPENIP